MADGMAPTTPMTPNEVRSKIAEVERLRYQERLWRWGSTGAVVVAAVVSIASIANSVRGLTQTGPTQEAFVSQFSSNLQEQILPDVQNLAAQTLTEVRPEIEKEFVKLNERVPEMTESLMHEMEALQTNVPERGQRVLAATLKPMLEKKEDKIRQMFPEATEENVARLTDNLIDQSTQHAVMTYDTLFGPHMVALESIVEDMEKIRLAEKPVVGTEQSSWEMGLLVFDVVREDLKELEPKKAAASPPPPGTKGAPASPSAAAAAGRQQNQEKSQ